MNCINRNTKEYIDLQKESKLSKFILDVKISKWQEKNGLDKFPELKDLDYNEDVNLKKIEKPFNLKMIEQQSKKQAFELKSSPISSKETMLNEEDLSVYDSDKTDQERSLNRSNILNALFDGKMSPTTSNEFLKNLKRNNSLNLNKEAIEVIDSLLTSRSKIKFVSGSALSKGDLTFAEYDPVLRVIKINRDILGNGNVYFAIESVIHEILHDTTINAYNNPTTQRRQDFKNGVDELYALAKKMYPNQDAVDDFYGLKNEFEFISELVSNKAFRENVRKAESMSSEDLNIFQRFFNLVKKLIGIKSDKDNIDLVDKVIESILDVSKNEYDYDNQSPLSKSFQKNINEDVFNSVEEINSKLKGTLYNLNSEIGKIKDKLNVIKSFFEKKNKEVKVKDIEELIEEIEKRDEKEAIHSVVSYVDFALSEMNVIESYLQNTKYSKDKEKLGSIFKSINLYSDTGTLKRTLNYMFEGNLVNQADYEIISDSLNELANRVEESYNTALSFSKDVMAEEMAPYDVEIKRKYEDLYKKEAIDLGFKDERIEDYIHDKMNENKDVVDRHKVAHIRSIMDLMIKDISSYSYNAGTEFNTDSTVLNISHTMILEKEKELRKENTLLRNEMISFVRNNSILRSSSSDRARYDFMIENTDDGYYYTSKYSSEFLIKVKKLRQDRSDAKTKEERIEANKIYKAWLDSNVDYIKDNGNILIQPKDKWLSKKYSSMSTSQKEFYDKMMYFVEKSNDFSHGHKSLIERPFKDNPDIKFVRMHGITRTNKDKFLSFEIGNAASDSFLDMFKNREDETEYGDYARGSTDINNKPINVLPLFFRGRIKDKKNQSLDIPNMILMDLVSSNTYNKMYSLENDMSIVEEILTKTEYVNISNDKKIFSKYKKMFLGEEINEDDVTKILGKDSNTLKKFKSMLENRVYKITDIYAGQLFNSGLSVNKLSSTIAGYTANLQLGLNYLSAVPNAMQALIQNRIEAMGGDVFDNKSLNLAHIEYWKHIGSILSDVESYVSQSKVNMVMDLVDTSGEFKAVRKAIQDSNKLRGLASLSTLHVMNSMPEHYAQSIMTIAAMKKIKVKNSSGKFINKKGEVVKKSEAMDLFEAYEKVLNKDTGIYELRLNKNVDHTSFSRDKYSEIGEVQHIALIKNTVEKVQGQYDKAFQNHIQRYWWGKLLFMFRKWMIPGYTRRYRGFKYSFKDRGDLSREQKYFNFSKQDFDEGTYTSFIRFIARVVFPALTFQKNASLSKGYKNLSELEKANLRRVAAELSYAAMSLVGYIFMAAMAEGDDDDDLYIYLAFLFKRQQLELNQYYSVRSSLKSFVTPAASISSIQRSMDVFSQLLGFSYSNEEGFDVSINDTYKSGKNKGDLKIITKLLKATPVIARTQSNAKDHLKFLEIFD